MDKGRLTKIMNKVPMEILGQWKEGIPFTYVKKPKLSLVMMRGSESVQGATFNVGEILVTECTVSVNGVMGFGVVIGDQEERAEVLAIADCFSALTKEAQEELLQIIQEHEGIIKEEEQKRFAHVARTKVSFEEMNG